ncbi:MAG: ATP-binding cassette domain-containing protein [Deltaproteobacteria bacterium]|nr:ATP-binding cassette domain-containing protein [Deltaproteobacteria bacterium]
MLKKITHNSEPPPLLQMHNASVVRNGKRILDGLTLDIREGEHTAILGPNGAGKSSFIRLITREDYPLASDNGRPPLLLFGEELWNRPPLLLFGEELWNVFALRSRLGIISADLQAHFLSRTLPGRTRGLDAVLSGWFASYGIFRHHKVTGAMKVQAQRALALLEAAHLAEDCIETMSTGEIRRILLARALVTEPQALILDEPTTGLDLLARSRFLKTLQKIARRGKTIILVTHRVEEIFPEIDRVILLKQGRIMLAGRKREVLTSQHLSNMFGAPIRVQESNDYFTASSGD